MANEILLERSVERIAVLRLNLPEAMNAIIRAMTRALRNAIAELEADDSVDVIVLAASGERAFCSGVDLKERQTFSDSEAAAYRAGEMFPMYRELDGRSKPAVAAVFGHTLAGGFELALSCDLIVAAEGASFGLLEVNKTRRPANVVIVAQAAKMARTIWAVTAKDQDYQRGFKRNGTYFVSHA